jgi:RNA polymerase sigma factor (sigma-70 family)
VRRGRSGLTSFLGLAVSARSEQLSLLVQGAACGDRACWDALVERFGGLVWSVARGFGTPRADAAEISQTTWLRLAEHINRIEHPERVGAWLVTTTRRECLRQRRLRGREVFVDEDQLELEPRVAPRASGEWRVLAEERDAALWCCFEQLPERSRTLLLMLLSDPPIPYAEIAEALDMPIGSIGPTRSRILATLRRRVEAAGVAAGD